MTTPTPEPVVYDWTAMATQIMYELLGRRLVFPRMRAVDAYPVNREIILTGRPVNTVHTVSVVFPGGTTVLDPANYQLYSGFRLRIGSAVSLPRPTYFQDRCHTEVHVDYTYGSKPPLMIARAIAVYAEQLELASIGSSECKLPKRVTSIARQGVNMTILDPQDYLDKGLTGLPEVDQALSVYNLGKAKARARLFTEKNPPARRLSVVAVPEEPTP